MADAILKDTAPSQAAIDQGGAHFQSLRHNPAPQFIDTLFVFLIEKIELRALENDITDALRADDFDDTQMQLIVAWQDAARASKERIDALERTLDEEAGLMRSVAS